MKSLCIKVVSFYSLLMLIACSQSNPPGEATNEEKFFQEVLLRTRSVYQISKNVDYHNATSISFYREYPYQLIELNLKLEKMNTSFLSVWNSGPLEQGNGAKSIFLSDLGVEMDGIDITNCIISECNRVSCTETNSPLLSLGGIFSTDKIYINLTKAAIENSSCSSISLSGNESTHIITFKERSRIVGVHTGGKVTSQVIVYNRPYRPADIMAMFEEENGK